MSRYTHRVTLRRASFTLLLAGAVIGGTSCQSDEVAGPHAPETELALGFTAAPALSFRQISGGNQHSCGVALDNLAYCWGANFDAQLGDGTTTGRLRPTVVSGGLQFTQVSAGTTHTCGLTTDSRVFCWGRNDDGQLGDGSTTSSPVPRALAGGRRFRLVISGYRHSCAVTTSNVAFCWGDNSRGQLGDGTTTDRAVPARVAGGRLFLRVSAGEIGHHTCGVTTDNRGYCWGENTRGQLGDNTTSLRLRPVAVGGGHSFRQVVAGSVFTCGVTTSDRAYCWGSNEFGRLGDGLDFKRRLRPNAVAGDLKFSGLSPGYAHTCGVTTTNTTYCWGGNWFGHLGNGTTTDRSVPVAVSGMLDVVSTGGGHSCGITPASQAYCWGRNNNGQVGDGTTVQRLTPVAVVGPI